MHRRFNEVTFIDKKGEWLLRTMSKEGAQFIATGIYIKHVLEERSAKGRSAFSTWLTRIVITGALMFLRRSRGLREVLIDDLSRDGETTTSPEVPDSGPDPEAIYSQREWVEMLSLALDELPADMRRAIQLHELDERSSVETAQIMGISVAALKGRMFHGRRKLRVRLESIVTAPWRSKRKTARRIANTAYSSQDRVAINVCR
jgi:RNA polymerase sigma-70 factor (ECF subfamily)